jgi:hypothetical protein
MMGRTVITMAQEDYGDQKKAAKPAGKTPAESGTKAHGALEAARAREGSNSRASRPPSSAPM